MKAGRQFLVFGKPESQGQRLWQFLIGAIAITLFLSVLPARAAESAGEIWFDLHLENPSDSTSALVSWPASQDVTAAPANDAALTVVLDTVATSKNITADAAAADPAQPQLGQSGEDFIENLKAVLATKGFTFADGFDLPNQSAAATKLRIGINYTAFATHASTPVLPTTFEVWVRTNLLPPDSPAFRWSIRELAANPAIQALIRAQRGDTNNSISPSEIPEKFSLIVLPAEGAWLRDTSAQKPSVETFIPIFAVAVAAADTAAHEQVLAKPRTEQNRAALSTVLHSSFSQWPMTGEISFQDELSKVDNAYPHSDPPAWVLRLTAFNPVRSEKVSIDAIQLGTQGRQPWSAFIEHQQAAGKSMETLIAQKTALEARLTSLLATQMPWGSPHFATTTDHERRIAVLRQQLGVAAVETKVFRDEVAYSVVWYPVFTTLEASGTYNSDRGGNVNTKLSMQARDFGASVEAYIANRRRGVFADISTTPKLTQLPDQAMATWSALADYTRENPVRFGTPKAFSLQDEESRAGLSWRSEGGHTLTSPASSQNGANSAAGTDVTRTRRWKLEVIAGYRRARLTAENFALAETPDGEAPFASTEFTGEWEHGFKGAPPTSTFHLELNADGSTAHATASSFARGQFKATEEIRLGHDRWENSIVRLTASGGAASPGTPVAWWFRLGGDERMRGFELGELTGRSFVYAGLETGVGLGVFLPKPTTTTDAKPSLPFDFRQIRFVVGIEHAWISDTPRFIPPAPTLRNASSYSLTGEYAGAIPGLPGNSRLAIGYGYAPESSHRSGRVFVSLRVPLSIPQPH